MARRRADALAGASAVFAAKGYHSARMTEIAVAAELSRASLYAMFKSKEELFQQVIASTAVAMRDTVRGQVESLQDPGQQLLCVIDSLLSFYEENRDLFRIYVLGTHGLPAEVRDAVGESSLRIFFEFMEWVVGVSKRAKGAGYLDGLNPEAVGTSLVGTVTTAAMRWIETTPEKPLSRAAPQIRAIFAQLLRNSEDP
jgi:AcrR family transcriptional regulator